MNDARDDADVTPEVEPVAALSASTVRDLATAAELLPETFKGDRRRPVIFNHRFWQLKVAMERRGWTLDSQTTKQEFDAAIQDVAGATAR
jgi:hypothetical protein